MAENRTPSDRGTADRLCDLIEAWHQEQKYSRCIHTIEEIPEEEWDYRLTYFLARAYQDLVLRGDDGSGATEDIENGRLCMERARDLLDSIWDDGIDLPEWNEYMSYCCAYLDEYSLSVRYARRWLKLEPDSELAAEAVESFEQLLQESLEAEDEEADEEAYDEDDDEGEEEEEEEEDYDEEEPCNEADDDEEEGGQDCQDQECPHFSGGVFLEQPSLDLDRFAQVLEHLWGIQIDGIKETGPDFYAMAIGDSLVIVILKREPVPQNVAAQSAKCNYLWPGAMDAIRRQRASITIMLAAKPGKEISASLLLIKLLFTICRMRDDVVGIRLNGALLEPNFFVRHGNDLYRDKLPVPLMVWIGMQTNGTFSHLYTMGMRKFGKDEIEVTVSRTNIDELRQFLNGLIENILEDRLELCDGDHVVFYNGVRYQVTYTPGIVYDGMTFKLSLP